jgi:hypothetical protein
MPVSGHYRAVNSRFEDFSCVVCPCDLVTLRCSFFTTSGATSAHQATKMSWYVQRWARLSGIVTASEIHSYDNEKRRKRYLFSVGTLIAL